MLPAKKMNEFLTRLEGPEGCNFQGDEVKKITWRCKGGNDKTYATAILTKMGVSKKDIDRILKAADDHGGHCDCEILFNAEEHLMKIAG